MKLCLSAQALSVLLFWATQGFAQQVVNAAGATLSDSTLTVEYAVGEIAITTIQDGGSAVTQGVLQPTYQAISETNEAFDGRFYFRVFPNPATDRLLVETNCPDFHTIQLFDSGGRLLAARRYDGSSLDLSALAPGVYFVHFQSNQYVKTIKLIKQ